MGRSGRLVYRGRRVGSVWVGLALMQSARDTDDDSDNAAEAAAGCIINRPATACHDNISYT